MMGFRGERFDDVGIEMEGFLPTRIPLIFINMVASTAIISYQQTR